MSRSCMSLICCCALMLTFALTARGCTSNSVQSTNGSGTPTDNTKAAPEDATGGEGSFTPYTVARQKFAVHGPILYWDDCLHSIVHTFAPTSY
ncbi:MAG: hypothetical protein PVS3B3_13490 [Ktedonobacteraceae bacterium]